MWAPRCAAPCTVRCVSVARPGAAVPTATCMGPTCMSRCGWAPAGGCCTSRRTPSTRSGVGSRRPDVSKRRWRKSRRSISSCSLEGSLREWTVVHPARVWWHPWPICSWRRSPEEHSRAMSGPQTITRRHFERLAIVYVRQSTLAQVREHTESTARQYALADEAVRLGWSASAIVIIDADLGLSGRTASGRTGFKELVSRVCLGEVGAIFGLEISRLARSSADLQRLLEFCSLTDTLIVDADGIYNLQNFNDRLVIGLNRPDSYRTSYSTSRGSGSSRDPPRARTPYQTVANVPTCADV